MHKLANSTILCRRSKSFPVGKVVQKSTGAINHRFGAENQCGKIGNTLFGEIQIKCIG